MSPTNEAIFKMAQVWRARSAELHEAYFSEYTLLDVDYGSASPPPETVGRSSTSRISLSAIASAVNFQELRARQIDPNAMVVDTITARYLYHLQCVINDLILNSRDRVAGGYIDLAHLTSAQAADINRFFRRILYLFGAPGDPIPVDDEGRSARLRLLRYLTIGLLHVVFGPWAPHSALDTADAKLLRRLITTAVRASLQKIVPAPNSKCI